MARKHRTISEAAVEALKKIGKPLSAKDIYNVIIEHDLYRFNAEDPAGIVKVQIRRHCEGLDFPSAKSNKIFQILRDGTYWINSLPIPGHNNTSKAETVIKKDFVGLKSIVTELKTIHVKHTQVFKQQIIHQLKQVTPKTFEMFSKRLLEVYGFSPVHVTKYSKDGGIDGHGQLKVGMTHLNVAFQCKRWNNNSVSRIEIDKFRGAIQGEYEQGIIFTTSKFSKEALGATRKMGAVPIILIDGETLVDIMIEKKFGIEFEVMPVYINALDSALVEE